MAKAAAAVASDRKLEAAIDADLDNSDSFLVYADWLQAQADPRGELIALQHAKKKAAANKLLAKYPEHFWGKAAELQDMLARYAYSPIGADTAWRDGYLYSLWISNKSERSPDAGGEKPEADVAEVLGWLLDHASTRFLRELTVGIVDFSENSYAKIATLLAKKARPSLRKLILGDFYYEETELNWSTTGKLEPMYPALRSLESLTLRSGKINVGAIDLPNLRELRIIGGGLDKKSLANICAAKWPKLETLNIQLGDEGGIKLEHIRGILDGKVAPHIKHLGLGNSTIAAQICDALWQSKIAGQLESIDMALGTMTDADANTLARNRAAFKKLKTIDVAANYLTNKGLAALRHIAKVTQSVKGRSGTEQKEDEGPEDRYISGNE
jgi:uncharacterized protein (TIGR02996 family)